MHSRIIRKTQSAVLFSNFNSLVFEKMLAYINAPGEGLGIAHSEVVKCGTPSAALIFSPGFRLKSKLASSAWMQNALADISEGQSLLDTLATLGVSQDDLIVSDVAPVSSNRESLRLEYISVKGGGAVLVCYEPEINWNEVSANPLGSSEVAHVRLHSPKLKGTVCQKSAIQLAGLFKQSFIIGHDLQGPHGQFTWFERVRDITVVAAGGCTGNPVEASQLAAAVQVLLQLLVVEQGYTDAEEIMNRLSYYIYKHLKDAQTEQAGVPSVEISLCVINKKTKVAELTSSGLGLFYQQQGQVVWQKGSRAVLGDPKILLSKQDFRSTKIKPDDLAAVYLYTPHTLDLMSERLAKPLGKARMQNMIESCKEYSMADQNVLLEENFNAWTGTANYYPYMVVGLAFD